MMAGSRSTSATRAGVRTGWRSPVTTARRSASPSLSTAVTVKPWAMSQQPSGSAPKTFVTSWCSASNIASGRSTRLPEPIEWLTDNGSCYTAHDTRAVRPRHRSRALHHASRKPAVERHGRGLRPDVEARLRQGQSPTKRPRRHRAAAGMVRPLQRGSPAPRPRLPFTHASSSLAQPMRTCQTFRGQQQWCWSRRSGWSRTAAHRSPRRPTWRSAHPPRRW